MNDSTKDAMLFLTIAVTMAEGICLWERKSWPIWRVLALQAATVTAMYSLLWVIRSLTI